MRKFRTELTAFLREKDLDGTNNAAERAIRPVVVAAENQRRELEAANGRRGVCRTGIAVANGWSTGTEPVDHDQIPADRRLVRRQSGRRGKRIIKGGTVNSYK